MPLIITSLCGLALFLWPFLGLGVPADAPALAITLAAVVVLISVELGTRTLDTRHLALLATIAALDSALRLLLVTGIAGFSPIFFLVLCAGYVLGPQYGFIAGAASLLASAVVTGGAGPWVPYEMFGVGWVGMIAGLCGLGRRGAPTWHDIAVLAIAGAVLGLAYGAVLDVWDWTTFRGDPGFGWSPGMPAGEALHRFGHFYVSTSFAYDLFRSAGNAAMVIVLGRPVLLALRRFQVRFRVEIVEDATRVAPETA